MLKQNRFYGQLVLTTFFIVGCSQMNASPDQGSPSEQIKLYQQGLAQFKSRQYKLASDSFRYVVDQNPDSAISSDALYWLGNSYFALGDCNQTISTQSQLLAKWPSYKQADKARETIAFCQKQTEKTQDKTKSDSKGSLSEDGMKSTKYPVPEREKEKLVSFGMINPKGIGPASAYLIKSSVVRNNEVAHAKVIINFEDPLKTSNGSHASSTILEIDFDCKTSTQSRTTKIQTYEQPFGKGKLIETRDYLELGKADWEDIKPKSFQGQALKSACYLSDKKSFQGNTPPKSLKADGFLEQLKKEELSHTLQKNNAPNSYLSEVAKKVRSNVVLPKDIEGNPISKFKITQLPSGEIIDVLLVQSSGNPALDSAVERGIRKSSPLPMPKEGVPSRVINLTYVPF